MKGDEHEIQETIIICNPAGFLHGTPLFDAGLCLGADGS